MVFFLPRVKGALTSLALGMVPLLVLLLAPNLSVALEAILVVRLKVILFLGLVPRVVAPDGDHGGETIWKALNGLQLVVAGILQI